MKNLKILIITTTIAILAVATIGVALAHNYGNTTVYGGMMGYSTTNIDNDWWTEMSEHMEDHWNEIGNEDWWTEMREHMDDRWDDVQEEGWYNDMRAYMDEHFEDVKNQEWFDEMTAYMEERNFGSNYRYGYGCR